MQLCFSAYENEKLIQLATKMLKCIFILIIFAISVSHGCNHRDYGNGATVCVCSQQLGCDNLQLNISRVKGIVTSYLTTKAGERFVKEEFQFTNFSQKVGSIAMVVLNPDKKYQKVVGFGGAFTDAAGINIASLSTWLQNRLIRDYFAEDGLEYRIGRIPIGGTDFSTRPYTYDDAHPDDGNLSSFALQPEDLKYKIPYIKKAQNVSSNQLKFLASSWSPSAWMKTNNAITKGYLKGVPGGKYYELYSKYLVRFLQEYNRNNVTLWGLSVQNEPLLSKYINSSFNSLLMNAQMERDFLKLNLGPELTRSGYQNLQVLIYDENVCMPNLTTRTCLFDDLMYDYVSTVLEDKIASQYATGIGIHWYFTFGNRSAFDLLVAKFSDKFLLSTEACIVHQGVSLGNWTNFDRYADDIISDLNHYTSGWIDWNLALDTKGGPNWAKNYVNAPIIVNATAQEYLKQPMFYALGHFSKFLVPDSVRIDHQLISENLNIENSNFLVTTFERPDNGTVLVMLNKNSFSVPFILHDPLRGFLSGFVKANSLQSFVWY